MSVRCVCECMLHAFVTSPAPNFLGLYSVFLHLKAISCRSNLTPMFTDAVMF